MTTPMGHNGFTGPGFIGPTGLPDTGVGATGPTGPAAAVGVASSYVVGVTGPSDALHQHVELAPTKTVSDPPFLTDGRHIPNPFDLLVWVALAIFAAIASRVLRLRRLVS
jgi:hypothetical protein